MKSSKRKTGGAYRRYKHFISRHAKQGKDRKRANSQQHVNNSDRLRTQPDGYTVKYAFVDEMTPEEFARRVKMCGLGIKE